MSLYRQSVIYMKIVGWFRRRTSGSPSIASRPHHRDDVGAARYIDGAQRLGHRTRRDRQVARQIATFARTSARTDGKNLRA